MDASKGGLSLALNSTICKKKSSEIRIFAVVDLEAGFFLRARMPAEDAV